MRKIYIDSLIHYQLKKDPKKPGKLLFLEYGTGNPEDFEYDQCPGMGQRGPFLPSEGRVLEEFEEGEEVEFIYSAFESKITESQAGEKVVCGDDLKYLLEKICHKSKVQFSPPLWDREKYSGLSTGNPTPTPKTKNILMLLAGLLLIIFGLGFAGFFAVAAKADPKNSEKNNSE